MHDLILAAIGVGAITMLAAIINNWREAREEWKNDDIYF